MSSQWLVQTRLRPPAPHEGLIERSALNGALTAAVTTHPLTLVSAPAGYGKTTLLASLPRLLPELPLAWLSLEADDNDPAQFFLSLTGALQQVHPGFGEGARQLQGADDPGARARRIIGSLINEALSLVPAPFVLVLDDLHIIDRPELFLALEYLVERLPPHMHLVIGTRHDPPLPLARMAARRQMAEIRRSDLRFSASEAHRLLNQVPGLALAPGDLAALETKAEGWPAGLWLLANSLGRIDTRGGRAALLLDMAATGRYVFDFLADEVVRSLEPAIRTFLLQTSVLAELTPSACQAVTRDAQAGALLAHLYRRNLFLESMATAPGAEPVYRCHALFRDFLRQQLTRELPGQLADLHERAAAVVKTPNQRIAHYLAAGLWQPAAQAIARTGDEFISRGLLETVQRWIGSLPPAVVDEHPRLVVLSGRCAIERGDYPAALSLLRRGRDGAAAAGDQATEGVALTTLISAAALQGDFVQAQAFADEAATLPVPPAGKVQIHGIRAYGALFAGDWERAAQELDETLAAVPSGDATATMLATLYLSPLFAALPGCLDRIEGFCEQVSAAVTDSAGAMQLALHEQMISIHLWRGRLDQAIALGEAAVSAKAQLDDYRYLGPDTLMPLTVAYAARGNYADARRYADLLLRLAGQVPSPHLPLWLYTAGRTYCMMGRLTEARAVHDRMHLATGKAELPLAPVLRNSLGGLLALLEGHLVEAGACLARATEQERLVPITAAAGSARLLLARLYLEQRRPQDSVAELAAVIAEAEERRTPGVILREGAIILPVLRQAATLGVATASVTRLLSLLGADAGAERPAEGTGAEPLTQRERDVLRLIVAGASNREIAAELVITEETVKTHVARILRKLDVTSRARAAIRARELGWFA